MHDDTRPESTTKELSAAKSSATSDATPPPAPWWKRPGSPIAVIALLLSLANGWFSYYTWHSKYKHDQKAELTDTVLQLLQIPIYQATTFYNYPNQNTDNINQLYSNQQRMLISKAYILARELEEDAGTPELMTIGDFLVSYQRYADAKRIFRQAVHAADNFSDEVFALRSFGNVMILHGLDDTERSEGDKSFDRAMNIGNKYADVTGNPQEINATHAVTQLMWLRAWAPADCKAASIHLEKADEYIRTTGVSEWAPRLNQDASAWRDILKRCDDKNRLPPGWNAVLLKSSTVAAPPSSSAEPSSPANSDVSGKPSATQRDGSEDASR